MDSYLKSLEMVLHVVPVDDFNIGRIAQMTQKTNQLNLTTHRMTEQDIRDDVKEGWNIYCISVKDKFGDNGITGALFINPDNHIDNLLLSCRILGKGIEQAFLSYVLNTLHRQGAAKFTASYIPSKKNMQTADFYERFGFILTNDTEDGKSYVLEMTEELPIKNYYQIN